MRAARSSARATFALAALAVSLQACALGAPHLDSAGGNPCWSNRQCSNGNVCFLGECRGGSDLLGAVLAEVRSPSDAPYGVLQRNNLDLHASVIVDFALASSSVSGAVSQAPDLDGGVPTAVAGAQVSFTSTNVVIPGRAPDVQVQTGSQGAYTVMLPTNGASATWDVLVVPAPPQPPLRLPAQQLAPGAPFNLVLPAAARLEHRRGTVVQGGSPVTGARVCAVDASGHPLGVPVSTDANGAFDLTLPPGPPDYYLHVAGPTQAGSTLNAAAIPSFDARGPFSGAQVPDVAFDALPPQAQLSGRVVDAQNAPVAAARVYARSVGTLGWTLAANAPTAADGTFNLNLLAGHYTLEAAPPAGPGAPALSPQFQLDVPAGNTSLADVRCPAKISASGAIVRADGSPVGAGTQITATRQTDGLVSGRYAQAGPTDGSGAFVLVADPGTYRLELVPPPSSGLPRKLVTVTLAGDPASQALPTFVLDAPLEVVGTVRGPTGSPVAKATVDFFALTALGKSVVLLGSGVSNSNGQYAVVLPDVRDPAALVR